MEAATPRPTLLPRRDTSREIEKRSRRDQAGSASHTGACCHERVTVTIERERSHMPRRYSRRCTFAAAAGLFAAALTGTAAHASIINLIDNTSGGVNGALFYRAAFNPGGTGNLDPFVRLQHDNGPSNNSHSGNGLEQGYNTSG